MLDEIPVVFAADDMMKGKGMLLGGNNSFRMLCFIIVPSFFMLYLTTVLLALAVEEEEEISDQETREGRPTRCPYAADQVRRKRTAINKLSKLKGAVAIGAVGLQSSAAQKPPLPVQQNWVDSPPITQLDRKKQISNLAAALRGNDEPDLNRQQDLRHLTLRKTSSMGIPERTSPRCIVPGSISRAQTESRSGTQFGLGAGTGARAASDNTDLDLDGNPNSIPTMGVASEELVISADCDGRSTATMGTASEELAISECDGSSTATVGAASEEGSGGALLAAEQAGAEFSSGACVAVPSLSGPSGEMVSEPQVISPPVSDRDMEEITDASQPLATPDLEKTDSQRRRSWWEKKETLELGLREEDDGSREEMTDKENSERNPSPSSEEADYAVSEFTAKKLAKKTKHCELGMGMGHGDSFSISTHALVYDDLTFSAKCVKYAKDAFKHALSCEPQYSTAYDVNMLLLPRLQKYTVRRISTMVAVSGFVMLLVIMLADDIYDGAACIDPLV